MYRCASCGLAVIVTRDGKVIRACTCGGAIVAEMRVEMRGRGGVR